jgi:hypothetical protein
MTMNSMLDALRAEGPHPDYADELMLFGQFVGAWDLDITNMPPGGSETRVQGEVHFAWGLEGRAVVDVWIAPRRSLRDGATAGFYGTTIRFYDPEIAAWRSTWVAPDNGVVMAFIGRRTGDEIVLEGEFTQGTLSRWIFSEITPTRFHWREIHSTDGGTTWTITQEMHARRVS